MLSETQTAWAQIARRSNSLAQGLYEAMLAFCNQKRKGHKRKAEMSLVRRIHCNLKTIVVLSLVSYKSDTIFFKFPVGILLRNCMMDTIYALYLRSLSAKEAEEEIDVLNKDYVKSFSDRFDVYKDRTHFAGLSEETLEHIYQLSVEDNFIQYLDWEVKDNQLTTKAMKSKDLRTIHDDWPENITINRMVERVKQNPRKAAIVTRINSYYKYFSQYEHFSEYAYGDSLAPFGSDNVSFPAALDALRNGLRQIVKCQ